MQLKLRHFALFIVACSLLSWSQIAAGPLLGMAAWLQIALLLFGHKLTAKLQVSALLLFLFSVPTLFFWGAVHSFVRIYAAELQVVFLAMAATASFGLSFLLNLQISFPLLYLNQDTGLIHALQESFHQIRSQRGLYLRSTALLFLCSLFSFISADWSLVLSTTVTHLYLNRHRLKTVIADF